MTSTSLSYTTPSTSGATTISAVHPDIIKTHIFTRLDGPTLVAATCASSELHALSSEDDHKLWRDLCSATWPSTDDPRVKDLIAAFPSGHRSFFSDSSPLLDGHLSSPASPPATATATAGLISAVDIFYEGRLVFSRVHESETETGWFKSTPFRVDLVGQSEPVPIPIRHGGAEDAWLRHLEENITLSWIVIDPVRKRAANVSSRSAVSVQRHWLSGDVQVRFGTVFTKPDPVRCGVVVTCGGKEGGEMEVSEVSMQVEDMDGKILNGEDSLVILQGAIGSGRRKRRLEGQDGKISFNEFDEMKNSRRKRMQRKERTLDLVCIATGVTSFISFWSLVLFR